MPIHIEVSESTVRDALHFLLGAVIARILKYIWKGVISLWKFLHEGRETQITVKIKGSFIKEALEFIFFIVISIGIGLFIERIL
jgi:hypothetical protein